MKRHDGSGYSGGNGCKRLMLIVLLIGILLLCLAPFIAQLITGM